LNATDFAIELSGFVQLINVKLAFEIVAMQFADEKPTAFVPTNTGRFGDERFAGDEFETESRRQLCEFCALGWGQRLGSVIRAGDLCAQNCAYGEDKKGSQSNRIHTTGPIRGAGRD
jgi:hypothetical protein